MVGKGSATATAFKNSVNRRIYQGEKGGFFVLKDGKKVYSPKASFRQVGDGNKAKVTRATANVPTPLRRAVRKNAGKARGPREGTAERRAAAMFKSPKARKVRSNKGVKRGPKKAPVGALAMMKAGLTPNEGNLTRMLFATPKTRAPRKNAGVARGPRGGTLLRRMNTESRKLTAKRTAGRKAPQGAKTMMKAGLTPEEGNLFRMIFATPKTRKVRSNKGKARKPKATPKPKVNIFVSPGGTALTKRQIAGRKAAATRKAKVMRGNPFAALA